MSKVYARTTGYESYHDWEGYMEPYIEDGTIILKGEDERCSFNLDKIKKAETVADLLDDGFGLKDAVESTLEKENGKKFTPHELKLIKDAYDKSDWRERDEYLETVLSILYGKKYHRVPIHGCSQGDYAEIFCDTELDVEVIRDIEAIYFGTGAEIIVDDSDEEITDPATISGYHIYTSKWDDDDLREIVADNAGCDIKDVVLWKCTGYHRVADYELI